MIEIFLGGGLLASFASFIYPVLRYLVPPAMANLGGDEVVAAKLGDLKPNSGKIFRFGSRPGLLILNSDGTYRALSATCTHLGCLTVWKPELGIIACPCHGSKFKRDGTKIAGPAPRPLPWLKMWLTDDGDLMVDRAALLSSRQLVKV